MNYQAFEQWLDQLSESDRRYLEHQSSWKKLHQQAQAGRKLPRGFVEITMEILEGGSESET